VRARARWNRKACDGKVVVYWSVPRVLGIVRNFLPLYAWFVVSVLSGSCTVAVLSTCDPWHMVCFSFLGFPVCCWHDSLSGCCCGYFSSDIKFLLRNSGFLFGCKFYWNQMPRQVRVSISSLLNGSPFPKLVAFAAKDSGLRYQVLQG